MNRILLAAFVFSAFSSQAQLQFSNANNRLSVQAFNSGVAACIVDWNNDGLDDIVRLKDGEDVYVEVQRVNQTFETRHLGNFNGGSAWSMAVADVDHNGYKDIVAYTDVTKLMTINSTGTAGTITSLPGGDFFAQNLTFADFNNDGWVDLFACDDNAASHIYMNDGTGVLTQSSSVINFDVTNSDDSGNYGSVYTDFDNDGDLDLYIAKCRQGVNNPTDPRRINVMFVNNGDGTYTEDAATYGLAIGWQTWTASFGDIDNDGDLDLLATNHDYESQILENDGSGHFTDITATTGFDITDITPIQSVMEDFDNDGFIDLFITGSDSRLWRNNGDKTFTLIDDVFNSNNMESFAIGDLNHDGKVDIYASYATIYTNPSNIDDVIWMNAVTNTNHYLTVDLHGTQSNPSAIGARATIYGAWGVQIREVRAGESYGTINSAMLHFGLGAETQIDSIVIHWPSGVDQTIENPLADQFLQVTENGCVATQLNLIMEGPSVVCDGQPVSISTSLENPETYNFLWSTGATTPSITVTTAGEFNVVVTSETNCPSISEVIVVKAAPDETPAVTVSGDVEFCNGSSVTLSGPDALASYLWSNGEETQSISVTEGGTYHLTIQGGCQTYNSEDISITVLTSAAPVTTDVIIPAAGIATLTATGENIQWYDQQTSGTVLGTGNTFLTPFVNTTATFFVGSSIITGGELYNGGLPTHTGTSDYSGDPNTNAAMIFDVLANCTLNTVTVMTDFPGNRKIELRNSDGVLINSLTVFIEDSMDVQLNFPLTAGTDYTLETEVATNQLIVPTDPANGPRLKRNGNNSNVSYPYPIGDLATITGSATNSPLPTYFFYFYNWRVENDSKVCNSELVPVTVTVDDPSGISEIGSAIKVYPNPADSYVSIITGDASAEVTLFDQSGRMVTSRQIGNSGTLSLDELAAGFYNLRISTKTGVKMTKLIVE